MKTIRRAASGASVTRTMRRYAGVVAAIILVMAFVTPQAAAQVAISGNEITIQGESVLTMGNATPLYARATGENNPANRVVKLGDTVLINNYYRGLTLSIFDANGHVSSTNYDTFISVDESALLTSALATLGNGQIGLLTSADAFEQSITEELRAQARRLGLNRLAARHASADMATWRHPYVAIFYGSPANTPNRQAVEILQSNAGNAPYAILATWLMDDGFVGQALEEGPDPPCFNTTQRFVDCGNGTVTDTVTGLIYLKNTNCFGFNLNWPSSNQAAAGLADGACGLSDGSRTGDWRLQTKEEWQGLFFGPCRPGPEIVGNGSPTTGCFIDNPWARDPGNATYWTSTTDPDFTDQAWKADLEVPTMISVPKSDANAFWPVRVAQ